ncbi:8215_t:CDS:2, partial [Funneliformis geosporum]
NILTAFGYRTNTKKKKRISQSKTRELNPRNPERVGYMWILKNRCVNKPVSQPHQ